MYVIYAICLVLLVLALKWELADNKRIVDAKNIDQIKTNKEKEIYYKFLAKFPYENAINWRLIYITSVFCALSIRFVFYLYNKDIIISNDILLFIFFIVFLNFYLSSGFKQFHFYRILASKADPNITIL